MSYHHLRQCFRPVSRFRLGSAARESIQIPCPFDQIDVGRCCQRRIISSLISNNNSHLILINWPADLTFLKFQIRKKLLRTKSSSSLPSAAAKNIWTFRRLLAHQQRAAFKWSHRITQMRVIDFYYSWQVASWMDGSCTMFGISTREIATNMARHQVGWF